MPRASAPRVATQTRGNANCSQHARAIFARACCEQVALPRERPRHCVERILLYTMPRSSAPRVATH
eukprot:11132280-Lingulodinium_polyedra.AAC.1